jgi:hypothetical protein
MLDPLYELGRILDLVAVARGYMSVKAGYSQRVIPKRRAV